MFGYYGGFCRGSSGHSVRGDKNGENFLSPESCRCGRRTEMFIEAVCYSLWVF